MSVITETPEGFEKELRHSINFDRGEKWEESYDNLNRLRIINREAGVFIYIDERGYGETVRSLKDPNVVVAKIFHGEAFQTVVANRRIMMRMDVEDSQKDARKEFWKGFKGF